MKDEPEANRTLGRSASMVGVALGALAVGAFAIGTLVGGARFKSLHVAELTVTCLRVSDVVVSESLRLPPTTPREGRDLE